MSKRLQVVLDEQEWEEIRDSARARGLTVSAWVREVLRDARRNQATGDKRAKLESIRASARHSFPTADIDQMLAEIERGYRGMG